MHDFGFKTLVQPFSHSLDRISKRQFNLIGFSSDNLVDRSTRRGVLFVNPLDTTTGNLPHLWTSTQGNPHAPVVNDSGIIGAGAVQGKLDFLCRIYGALDLLEKRHKNPLYLVGTGASNFGMAGSRFLIESLAVNPKEVFNFAPTKMAMSKQAPGQVTYAMEVDTAGKDRDSRGYNRCVEITAFGMSVDLSNPSNAISAFDLLMDILLDAAGNGFDFQWSELEVKGAAGCNPDVAYAKVYLTAFQFEDFRQFLRGRLDHDEKRRFFRIEYLGVLESGTRFIPNPIIEMFLELDFEWKNFVKDLNSLQDPGFEIPQNIGALTRIERKNVGKLMVNFEMRFLPNHTAKEIDEKWKSTVQRISKKYEKFYLQMTREFMVPGVSSTQPVLIKSSNYLSDAGWFHKGKFPVTILGAGSIASLPKGPNEAILWEDLKSAVHAYRELMMSVCG